MKRLTYNEMFKALVNQDCLTPYQVHIAMAVAIGKNRTEMASMYGDGTLSTTLNSLKNKNVILSKGKGVWALNHDVKSWGKVAVVPAQKTPSQNENDKNATLEMMAELERKLNELKRKVG